MPYIKQRDRNEIDTNVRGAETPGELNYQITGLCLDYMDRVRSINYTTINEVIGALECAKQEFYRRIATPYEKNKIKENGDVY